MPRPESMSSQLSSSEAAEYALMTIANKMGVQVPPRGRAFSKRRSIHNTPSLDDESFIRTPPSGPISPSSPELSPPPAYDSLTGIPDLPGGAFALPPPALSTVKESLPGLGQNVESKTVILYVGRISWEKNIRLLIEAFKLLPLAVRNNAKLVFVGDGPARGDLTRLCKKHNLDATFMGHQKGKRLAAMYASSSVFAFPSFTETFGQVVLEALASGLPVVGLHAEGTSDLVSHGKTGLLMDVNAANHSQSNVESSIDKDLASAANSAGSNLGPSYKRGSFSSRPTFGFSSPIPTINDFAASMSPNTEAFETCAKSYSMLLEKLIQDRFLRMVMGQRAQLMAAHRTWWDAMDAVVRGYETVVATKGIANFSDEELEALRNKQQKIAPLTGPIIKCLIVTYLAAFLLLWRSLCPM